MLVQKRWRKNGEENLSGGTTTQMKKAKSDYPSMSEKEIEEIYKDLPLESRGRLADNPWKFRNYFGYSFEMRENWPFLLLCVDVKGIFTWRMGCDNYVDESQWMKDWQRGRLEEALSDDDRLLTFVELHDRDGLFYIYPEKEE